jgi:hypothetical protein
MKTLLWLDDIRDPKTADWLMMYAPDFSNNSSNVIWVKNYSEFIDWILKNDVPYKISFDHDLGEEKSGFDCAKWLVDYCLDNQKSIPNFVVHSANPVGSENIRHLLLNASKHI